MLDIQVYAILTRQYMMSIDARLLVEALIIRLSKQRNMFYRIKEPYDLQRS